MHARKLTTRGNRGGIIATAFAAVLIISAVGLMGVAIASQRPAPHVPPASSGHGADAMGIFDPSRSWWTTPDAPGVPPLVPEDVEFTLPRSVPVRLDIPSIDVHSVVQHLGQASDGSLETPAPGPLYNDAAWYRYSPTPGELGPAILLGHVDSAAEGPSVFFRLGELQPGDRVSVTRADDSIAVFVVDEVRRYAKDDFPTGTVYGDIDHAGLRILTCGGAFDNSTGHYLDNIVVFATLEGSPES